MPVMIITDSGREIDVSVAENASLVAVAYDSAIKRASDAEAANQALKAQFDANVERIADLEAKASDAAIAQRVQQIAKVTADAQTVAGKDFKTDSLDSTEIKRAALAVVRPKIEWADKEAAYVHAAFDMALESPAEDAAFREQVARVSQDGAIKPVETSDQLIARVKAERANAWKGGNK